MTSREAWAKLIDRVPDMQTALLRKWRRAGVVNTGQAAIFPEENWTVVGQLIQGLNPWERRALDTVVDEAFMLIDETVELLELSLEGENPVLRECTTYAWRSEELGDAWPEDPPDWDCEKYTLEYLPQFCEFCKDTRILQAAARMTDKELRELALVRKRRDATGEDDEESYVSEEEEPDEEESD